MEDYAELVDDGTRQAGADVLLLLAGGQLRRTQDLFDRLAVSLILVRRAPPVTDQLVARVR
jgi:hypothetical protein